MKELLRLQGAFQRHLLRPAGTTLRAVLSTGRAGAARRLAVYAEACRARLTGVLRSDFPALQGVLGQDAFDLMARDYILAHPSQSANLRWYGQHLAGFLARASRWRRRPVLAELARFEWALGLAFDAADAPLIAADDMRRIPPAAWPDMRLQLHPSVQLLGLRSNAPKLWRAVDAGETAPRPRGRNRTRTWLVWRKGFEPFYRVLPPAEAWALAAAARGADFASLVQGLCRFVGSKRAALAGAQFLRNWLEEGLVSAIDVDR